MTENRDGQVVTFYSFKGGTGRTMALANVAWILAANGKRVLVADWDLESPGLHRFFSPFMNAGAVAGTGGVIDLIRTFEWATTREGEREERWHERYARVQEHAFSLDWTFPAGGMLDFLAAGRQNNDYAASISGLDWDNFYEMLGGGQFFDALRADMKRQYDYTLIDSRTGLSDVADICTIHLPDVLVDCFTFSEQGIDGAAQVAHAVQHRYNSRNIRILPVPMRVDSAEQLKAEAGRWVAMQRFAGLPSDMTDEERSNYWAGMQVPYRPYYAYEEILATFGDPSGSPTTLLSAYERLTAHITGGTVTSMPPVEESVRARVKARFERQLTVAEDEVILRYAPEDQVWAEWVEQVLVSAGVRVNDPWVAGDPSVQGTSSARDLVIISHVNAAEKAKEFTHDRGGVRAPLAVYVADVRPLPAIPIPTSAFVGGRSEAEAAERILKLLGRTGADVGAVPPGWGARFPGEDTIVFNAPARNARFTGRENDLRQLRAHLRGRGAAVVLPGALPVALQGMGGIGKTQVAMEYAHRFRSAYDVVWWIAAEAVNFVDVALVDLGGRLGIPAQMTVPETTRAVLNALSRGEPHVRWLLVFDNAEDLQRVGQFLPQGSGHTLITSRDPAWAEQAQTIQVDVFERRESIAHLNRRVPTIRVDEANRVAEVLGDLPIAVAAAGAFLADTGTPVEEYLRQVERHGPSSLPVDGSSNRSVEATWDLSLARLRETSPAGYRLLQMCSVLASEIALDLIYSDEMAAALAPVDPSLSEGTVLARLVQDINRLALLKVDIRRGRDGQSGQSVGQIGGQIQVHRLMQHVVRSRMSEQELTEARHLVHLVLAGSRPRGEVDDPEAWPRFQLLWPHLEYSDAVNCTDEAVRRLLIDRVRYLWLRGDLSEGRQLAQRFDKIWSDRLAANVDLSESLALRRQMLHLRFNLANIVREQGDFLASKDLDEATLAEQQELLGAEHPHTLMTAGGYAADLRGLGQYAEALERDAATHASWSMSFGDDHTRTLIARNNLASSYRLVGDYRTARDHDDAVYQRRRLVQGDEHPTTLSSMSSLGRDLREAGEYERSIALLRRVTETFTMVLGASSRGTLTAQANLAVSLRSAGRVAEAAGLLEIAYKGLDDSFGPTSPETLACRLSRAVNMLVLGETDQATRELEAVRSSYQDSLGKTHPHTLACVNNLAAAARTIDDRVSAHELASSASDGFGRVLGADHPYALAATMNLAVCTADEQDLERALDLARTVAAQAIRVLGVDHPDALRGEANVALMLHRLGHSGPEADESRVLSQLAARIGENHPTLETLRQRRLVHRVIDPHPY